MAALALAIQLLEVLVPLISAGPELTTQATQTIDALRGMRDAGRDPTNGEVAAQRALIAKLQAVLAAG